MLSIEKGSSEDEVAADLDFEEWFHDAVGDRFFCSNMERVSDEDLDLLYEVTVEEGWEAEMLAFLEFRRRGGSKPKLEGGEVKKHRRKKR